MLFNKQPLPYTLGWRGEIFMGVSNLKSSYFICNWCLISMVALKVESNPIIKYLNSINQAYSFVFFQWKEDETCGIHGI